MGRRLCKSWPKFAFLMEFFFEKNVFGGLVKFLSFRLKLSFLSLPLEEIVKFRQPSKNGSFEVVEYYWASVVAQLLTELPILKESISYLTHKACSGESTSN